MYLRTPKRYQKPQRHVLSLRWLWLWLLTPLVVVLGGYIYENRAEFGPPVQQWISDVAQNVRGGVATITAPTPLPTENPEIQLAQAETAWARGAIGDAIRHYQAVIENVPNDLQAHYRLGFGLYMEGRSDAALQAAEKAINANPFAADAWALRAVALNALGRQGQAIANAMQALQLDPDSARATAFLAEAYFDSNQIERALNTVEDALEQDPNSFEALYVYGRIQNESLYDFEEALDAFNRAYSLAPNMPYIGIEKAILHLNLQEPDLGFETLQDIVELNPENSSALYWMAYFSYAGYGDPNQALDYLTRCVTANPRSIPCTYYMGTVRFGMGDNRAAAEAFMRTIELGTTNPRHYLSAGRINSALNNCPVAIPLLREGYRMEQALPLPNQDRLVEFEEALRGCGAAVAPGLPVGPTPEPALDVTEEAVEATEG